MVPGQQSLHRRLPVSLSYFGLLERLRGSSKPRVSHGSGTPSPGTSATCRFRPFGKFQARLGRPGAPPPAPDIGIYELLKRVTQGVTCLGALEPGENRPVVESRRYTNDLKRDSALPWLYACRPVKGLEVGSGPRGVSSPCAWDGHQTGLLPYTFPDRESEGHQHAIAPGSRSPSIPSAPTVC